MRPAWLCIASVAFQLWVATTYPAVAGEYVRDQSTVNVGKARETWRLVWNEAPRPFCAVEDAEMSLTCPCSGWAFGETGKLSLVRSRGDREVERLELGHLFGDYDYPIDQARTGEAYLPRWPARLRDIGRSGDPNLVSEVKRRPPVKILRAEDYDRDGVASEFLIQVGTLPCGKHQFAAVGVSKREPRLHAFSSVAHPDRALVMPLNAWRALLAKGEPKPVVIWECDDHGSDLRSELTVSAHNGRIRAVDRDYACHGTGAGHLVKTTTW